MKPFMLAALLIGAAGISGAAEAQQAGITQTITGTRLDLNVTGETTRVPDIAVISAGVVTRAQTAAAALQDAADRMKRVRGALKQAGVEDRDVQTGNVSLNPEYQYDNGKAPQLLGYTASNQLTIRFRDIRNAGKILDALVAQGANQINGPSLIVDHPEAALDEARAKAVAEGKARAQLYARSLGMRVARLVAVSESGGTYAPPPPAPPMPFAMSARKAADTAIDAGEQKIDITLAMTFELQ